MGTTERCVGIGIGGAALASVAGMFGKYYERKADGLESNSFLRGLLETKKQTKDRLGDADSYEIWSDGLYYGAYSIIFVTTILVATQLFRKH